MNSRTKSGIFLHSSFRDPACACVKTDPLDGSRRFSIYSARRKWLCADCARWSELALIFMKRKGDARDPSDDDTSQSAQERLNRSKIGKAFAWE